YFFAVQVGEPVDEAPAAPDIVDPEVVAKVYYPALVRNVVAFKIFPAESMAEAEEEHVARLRFFREFEVDVA
ncbi:MAG: hypothetical protein QMB59_07130, partial [Bacteroidales bacterium]